jgi:hypothetical protein
MTNWIVTYIKPFLIILVGASDLAIPKASLPNGLFVDGLKITLFFIVLFSRQSIRANALSQGNTSRRSREPPAATLQS